MKIKDLEKYNPITIQCHDNPDADALGSGYGLYCYFKDMGKDVRLIYSGRNKIRKANLVLLVDRLNIPIEYIEPSADVPSFKGLLITVDCQYGAGNVTRFDAEEVAIIDHHQVEIEDVALSMIYPNLGSCSTLVWSILNDADYNITDDNGLGTALYYGLYTDTNQFSELHSPLDRDARDKIPYNNSLITTFRNSNLSLAEWEIAGIAMMQYYYDEKYRYAVIKSKPCDPNILGIISDFLLQVDGVDTCVVFNENTDGYKFSVRSCVRETNAGELAGFLSKKIGSGGGHFEKAGGFISKKLYEEKHGETDPEQYLKKRLKKYFEHYELIYPKEYEADISEMVLYRKIKRPIGFVKADTMLPIGTPITIRTLEGDMDMQVEADLYFIIGIKGEVYPNREEKFKHSYEIQDKKYIFEECVITADYVPTIKNQMTGEIMPLTDYAGVCVPTGDVTIYAKPLERGVKIFTEWDKEKYMLGQKGDYLAVRSDDCHDIYIIEKKIFGQSYSVCAEE